MNRRRFLLSAAGLLSAPRLRASATPTASGWSRLRLVDAHTGASFDGVYRDASGPIARVMEELSVFLRDHHSGRVTDIDVGVIRGQPVAVREDAIIRAARRALPFMFGTQTCAGKLSRLPKPRQVGFRVRARDAGDRKM